MSAPLRLRNGELLEELLAAQLIRHARHLRPEPRGEVVASSFRAFQVDLAAALEEAAHRRELLGVIALVSQSALEPPVEAA